MAAKKKIGGKPCQYQPEACADAAIPGERFCPVHRGVMLREMTDSGYFVTLPRPERRDLRVRADEWDTGRACDLVDEV